ncbi:MAG: tail fiber domain-containing protein [Candidatus Delongbacteria bacterium]|jgi:hypothetical protein|nr:tail fiber domain-containing protein [Candidatus Delongbacteria bacterium]
MKKVLLLVFVTIFTLNAQALFEVKDASDQSVFEITNDGIRIFNYPDTLMIISSSEIRANLYNSTGKGLSRSFSVSTNTTSKEGLANVLEVNTNSTTMREGDAGERYTDFSPENIFLGLNAGLNTISELNIYEPIYDGSYNVFVGNNAGKSNTSGWSNIFIGNVSGYSNTTAYRNVFIGAKSGYASNGANNTFVGYASGEKNTSGGSNSFFGDAAGVDNTTGLSNSFFGSAAGLSSTGSYNTIMGNLAGRGITGGTSYSSNCLFGYYAGGVHRTGNNNVMIGNYSGYSNATGAGNVFLGYQSGYQETGSNRLYIDNSSTTDPLIFGDFSGNRVVINGNAADNPSNYTFYVNGRGGGDYAWNSLSDKRLKKNINTIVNPIDIVNNLRGVYYEWKDPESQEKGRRIGFIAQEALEVLSEVVDNTGDFFTMQYAPITAVLVEAVKNQQIAIEENKKLKIEIDRLSKRLDQIEKLLKEIK